jgi:hypothetical protein
MADPAAAPAQLSTLERAGLLALVGEHRRSAPSCDCPPDECPRSMGHRRLLCASCRQPYPCLTYSESWAALERAEPVGTSAP